MKISELSRRTGVPVASIKYFLRQGLLPAGRATAATLAEYGEEHAQAAAAHQGADHARRPVHRRHP